MLPVFKPDRVQLCVLRRALLVETARLSALEDDPALAWAGQNLSRLLEPRELRLGLHDWVIVAALHLVVGACERQGRDATLPRRAVGLLSSTEH